MKPLIICLNCSLSQLLLRLSKLIDLDKQQPFVMGGNSFQMPIFSEEYFYFFEMYLKKKGLETFFFKKIIIAIEYLGALKQGPCTCNTFKAFNLTYLHVLRS